jgi:hypothetical protein
VGAGLDVRADAQRAPTEQRKEGKFKRRDCVLDWPVVGGLKPVPRFVPHFVGGDRTWSCEEGDPRSASMMLSADHRKKGVTDEEILRRSKKAAQSAREKPFSVQDAVRPTARIRSLCRFRNSGTEYLRKSGINWMIGCAKRKCDRTLPAARGAPVKALPPPWLFAGACRRATGLFEQEIRSD